MYLGNSVHLLGLGCSEQLSLTYWGILSVNFNQTKKALGLFEPREGQNFAFHSLSLDSVRSLLCLNFSLSGSFSFIFKQASPNIIMNFVLNGASDSSINFAFPQFDCYSEQGINVTAWENQAVALPWGDQIAILQKLQFWIMPIKRCRLCAISCLNQLGQMEIKSHLFEIMQFCFLLSVLLILYLSVLLKPNFLLKKKRKEKSGRIPVFFVRCHKCQVCNTPHRKLRHWYKTSFQI